MNTTVNTTNRENMNAANTGASNKINDFGAKIGGARKDLYQAANEWAAQLAEITAEALTKAGGVSKLVRLPNLEKMTEAGAISADQARAALVIWRGIERKPQGSYRADRWAERTRNRLEAAAAIITGTEPTADEVRDIITAARKSAEIQVLAAAQWPAVAFSFGRYSVIRRGYSDAPKLYIRDARYYCGSASEDPADIVRQLVEMVAADEEKAADRRAAGPALGVYTNRAGVYYIAPVDRSEIVLQTYENRADALKAYREDRAALVERYAALKNFPACRRDWNRPRVGEDWRKGENMTPERFAAVLPFRGVEFGNWVNQTERAALLNSAFDGFHDLAAVLNIAPAAVTLNGSLAFAFASRGHSGAAAHYEPARRVINLTKKSGAGCMAHEWWHAVDNFAAGGGVCNYATEHTSNPRAAAILSAIKKTAFYTRSKNLARFRGDYWTEGRELTARAFEGVCAVMLNAAGICSDFLVNCKSMDEFTREDIARRSDYYPYPTADEAAALLPLYIDFLRDVFGEMLTAPAACYEEAKRAAARAEAERQERERKAQEMREKAASEAEARKQAAAHTLELLREVLTARHFDTIATSYDAATAYAVAHLEGELYTMRADIKTADQQGRAYIEGLPAACVHYKRVHNAKRIICRRWQVPEIRANKYTARKLVEGLNMIETRDICRTYCDFEKAEIWAKAAQIWSDTQRAKTAAPATTKPEAKKTTEKPAKAQNGAPAEGLHLEEMADGVRVVGDDWKDTYFNKKAIKANGGHWNKEAKQWEATDPADVARLRAWFALRDGENITNEPEAEPTAPAATLEDPAEITAPTESAPALPEWLKVGAKVRTRGAYMISTRSSRPEWVEGEEMTVKAISAEFVELEKRDENGILTGLQSISTAKAADELTPVLYEGCKITAPAAAEPVAASYDTADPAPAATFETSATADEQQQADALPFMEKAAILDKVTARIYAPWGDVSKMWLCPFRGALAVWNAWAERYNLRDFGRLADWALTAKVGERAECLGLMVQIWERDGQTAAEPETEPDRLKANRETRERLRAAIVAELEAADVYIYPFNNEMKVICKVQNAEQLYKVQDIARRYTSAQFRHDEGDRVCEFVLPLFFSHIFPTDPTPEPSGEGEAKADNAADTTLQEAREIKAGPLAIKITREDIETTRNIYDFAAAVLVALRETNPESRNETTNSAYIWDRADIYRAADALKIDRDAFYTWCYDNSDFITTRVMIRATITTSKDSPAPNQAHRLLEWQFIEDRAAKHTPAPKGESDEVAAIISQAKQTEKWSANGKFNYGPIESLRAAAYKHTATVEEYTIFFDEHLNEVTNAETYCVWLLRAYDITVDETQVYCDLRRAFPAIGFKEACKLIKDHMSPEQQGNGIAAALVPDVVLIESSDQDTRRKFMERRKCYTNMIVKWAANGERHPEELRKRYDLDSMTLHALLDWELFYTWEAARAARALEDLREVYPEATADDLQRVFMATADGVTSIYG